MSTPARVAANRRNAILSTGPTTDAGKAVARMNALTHGLRAAAPVVPGEPVEQWQAFRDAVASDLSPVGVLESELADRVALLTWRLRRVAAFETGIVSAACENAVLKVHFPTAMRNDFDGKLGAALAKTHRGADAVRTELANAERQVDTLPRLAGLLGRWDAMRDDEPLTARDAADLLQLLAEQGPHGDDTELELDDWELCEAVGVPAEWRDDPTDWPGWTAGGVRNGQAHLSERDEEPAELRTSRAARAKRAAERDVVSWAERKGKLQAELERLEATLADREAEARRRVLLPNPEQTERVMKYEGHLQRQLMQTLHQLERMRAGRSEFPPQPPAVLDVTVDAPAGVLPPPLGS